MASVTDPNSGPVNPFQSPNTSVLTNATGYDQATAQQFFQYLNALRQNYQNTLNAQNNLVGQNNAVIAGAAPSVAQTQLQQGLGQQRAALSSQAAGATGQNAALANYGSIQALGAANAKANQDAALLRAQEVAQARAANAGILGQEQQATGSMAGTTTAGGTGLSGQAVSGGAALGNINANELDAQRNFWSNLIKGAGSTIAAAGAG